MKRTVRSAFVGAAILAIALAFGCGDDEKAAKPGDTAVIDIADGTWREVATIEWVGGDEACGALQKYFTPYDTTFVQCEVSASDFGGDSQLCSVVLDGSRLTIDCSTVAIEGPCTYSLTLKVTVDVYDKSYTSTMTLISSVQGDEGLCGDLTCTGTVHVIGTWVSAEGVCPSAAPAGRVFDLRGLRELR